MSNPYPKTVYVLSLWELARVAAAMTVVVPNDVSYKEHEINCRRDAAFIQYVQWEPEKLQNLILAKMRDDGLDPGYIKFIPQEYVGQGMSVSEGPR